MEESEGKRDAEEGEGKGEIDVEERWERGRTRE